MHSQKSLTRLSRLAGAIAFLTAIMPPLVFFALDYRYERASIHIEAEINAHIIGELINKNPELWIFEQPRLEELLGKRPSQGNILEVRRIYGPASVVLAERADPIRPPLIVERTPVYNAGRPAGTLEISRSLQPAIFNSLGIAIISLMFGIVVFASVRTIPLRALRQTIASLEEEKERAQVTLRSIGDAVVTTDEKMRIEYLNPIAEKMIGWTTEEAKGRPMKEVFHIIKEATREPASNPVEECLEKNDIVEMENHTILIRKTDGAEFHIEDSAAPIRRNNGSILGAIMVFHDVTERKAVQKSLNHMAHHDMLTGLPNRALFLDRLSKAIAEAKRQQKKVAVLFLDLDRFKIINDSLGHDMGDRLLLLAAQRLQHCVRASDTIARMGGDEFTAILEGIQDADDATRISEKIIAAISQPFRIDGESLFVTTSIGVAIFPKDGDSIDILLKNADAAMYQAKDHGRNAYKFYTPIANNRAVEKLRFESMLNTALERNEFFLEYQPKLDLRTSRVIGMEALIRWKSEQLGQVMPAHFIPILEESGLIVQVGKWVLRTALAQARGWIDAGLPVSVSVNFSSRQFRENNIVDLVKSALLEFDFPASLLEIEITESLLMDNVATIEEKLRELSAAGMKISLDDFGTGYSSLSYLRRFPIDVLKIDKSFVFDMGSSSSAAEIVKTIIDLGHALKMNVIAEGIETEEQLGLLKKAGCDGIQGYWLSPPMPGLTASNWLKSYSAS